MQLQRHQQLEYLTSPLISAPHGFSTRLGGVSEGYLASLNLGCHRGDREDNLRENYRRFCAATGTDLSRIAMTNQVHSTVVRPVTEAEVTADLLSPVPYEADALVTHIPGITLVIFTADCIPILLHDPVRRVAGAVHAGWRGTAGGIGPKTVRAMAERYGCSPQNIRAAIGPGIGKCCFETDADVPQAMTAQLGGELVRPFITQAGEKYHVDLKGINAALLAAAGLSPNHIDLSEDCTCCLPGRYWSHRYTQGRRGSQAAVIMLRGEEG